MRKSLSRASVEQKAQPPHQPSPVPSIQLSIHIPPILALPTSLTSETSSFVLRSPFVFGAFGPSALPGGDMCRASNMISSCLQSWLTRLLLFWINWRFSFWISPKIKFPYRFFKIMSVFIRFYLVMFKFGFNFCFFNTNIPLIVLLACPNLLGHNSLFALYAYKKWSTGTWIWSKT